MLRKTLVKTAPLLITAMLVAGCGGGGSESNATAETESSAPAPADFDSKTIAKITVDRADVPAGYEFDGSASGFKEGCVEPKTKDEAAFADRLKSLGHSGCHISKFRKAAKQGGGDSFSDIGLVAILFPNAEAASQGLEALRGAVTSLMAPSGDARIVSRRDLSASDLGDEALPGLKLQVAVGFAGDEGLLPDEAKFEPGVDGFEPVLYFWRIRNVAVWLSSFDVNLREDGVLTIARKIDFRATR